jgi:hypothetical protein
MTALGRLFTDIDDAWDLSVQAQQVADTADDRYGCDSARALQSLVLVLRDRHDDASPILQDVVDSLTRRGDRGIAATMLAAYSSSALVTGQIARARDLAVGRSGGRRRRCARDRALGPRRLGAR